MSQRIEITSQSPFYDDYDSAKDYVRVLFRPGYPVQARELTTLQTFLQEQISRNSDKVFNAGSVIEGGNVDIVNTAHKLVLTGSGNVSFPPANAAANHTLSTIAQLEGLVIRNATGTVKAKVLKQPSASSSQIGNLFFEYLTVSEFDATGGFVYATIEDNPTLTANLWNSFSSYTPATLAKINEGVVYVKGIFVRLAEQVVLVDASSNNPSAQIGFTVDETIITQNDDSSLYDNARGSSNEGAPGAHRLKLNLTFAIKSIGTAPDSTFYRLATIKNGVREEENYVSQEYGDLIDVMARRTHDESGSYTLKPFLPSIYAGSTTDTFNLSLSPSKAYVKGYEVEKRVPSILPIERATADVERSRNFKVPFVGTTSVEITNITSTLPGQTAGNPYIYGSRLLLRNASNQTIGVARAYGIVDSFEKGQAKTKLYLYDIKMFQVVVAAGNPTLTDGNDVSSLRTRAYVYNADGAAGITNGITLISSTGKFRVGQPLVCNVQGVSDTITAVTNFTLADVTTVRDSASFTADVTASTVENSNSMLLSPVARHVKSLQENGSIMDNDYRVIEDTSAPTTILNSANGEWDSVTYNDTLQLDKTINFTYLKVKNITTARSAINFGWSAADKEVSLFYPDGHKVYGINQTTDGTFGTGRFARIDISTSGNIEQGSVVVGNTSGSRAVVALSNSVNIGATQLSNNANYHQVETGTGSISTLEVIFTTGTSFTETETLTVTVPGGRTAFTNTVVYNSSIGDSADDVKGLYNFDNGQRNEFYDVARITRKTAAPAPTNDIVVFFSWFSSTPTAGHYYSADSYADLSFFGEDVRYFSEPREIKPQLSDEGVDLRNVIDFRLKTISVTDVAESPFNFKTRTFHNQGRILPKSQFTTDLDYYLGRIDKVALSPKGEFVVTKGVPSLDPKQPEASADSMDILYINIPPVARYFSELRIDRLDNRRYTMRDIGKLDKRIGRLEEAVALSLLESQALHDDLDGRTKIGFVVDDFSSVAGSPSDQNHTEFNSSIDTIKQQLVPAQTSGVPIEMEYGTTSGVSTFFADYIIKDFVEETMVEQLNATKSGTVTYTIPIQTVEISNFVGKLTITPDEDHWHERTDSYFTKQYGELQPFSGTPTEFKKYVKVIETTIEGSSSTANNWTGRELDLEAGSMDLRGMATAYAGGMDQHHGGGYGYSYTVQAQTNTSKTVKTELSGDVVTTSNGSTLIENPEAYFVRPVTISWSVTGLKPLSAHYLHINGELLDATTITTSDEGEATGTFTIPGNKYKAGTLVIELRSTVANSFASTDFKSIGYMDEFTHTKEFAEPPVATAVEPTAPNVTQQTPVYEPPPVFDGDIGTRNTASIFFMEK